MIFALLVMARDLLETDKEVYCPELLAFSAKKISMQ
jgi:hypothetical protein